MSELSDLVGDWGYLGLVPLVVLGNAGLPVPEEAVLAVAGYLAWRGLGPARGVSAPEPALARASTLAVSSVRANRLRAWRDDETSGSPARPPGVRQIVGRQGSAGVPTRRPACDVSRISSRSVHGNALADDG